MKLHNWFRSRTTAHTSPRTSRRRLAVEVLEDRALPSTFSVLNTNDSGPDSLRQAIVDANARANDNGPDVIQFNIGEGGAQTIALASSLPALIDAVTIDGPSQPGFAGTPLIELNGAEAGSCDGLFVSASRTTIRGLVINRFDGSAVSVANGTGNILQGNFIGTDVSGTMALPNREGIRVSANDAVIRGNLISGNDGNGISLVGASRATIRANTIGTNLEGTASLANLGDGIWGYLGTADNKILHNLISGNSRHGIAVIGTTTHNYVIQGNTIGANRAGTEAIGNGENGVFIYQAHDNLLGGSAPGQGNMISGNGSDGVQIALPSATGNVVQGNAIGTNFAGDVNLGNAGAGVLIWSHDERIGGVNAGEGNAIAYNGFSGVVLATASAVTIVGNTIHDNTGLGVNWYGAPDVQYAPVLTESVSGSQTRVAGCLTLASAACSTVTLDFYACAAGSLSGVDASRRYLGAMTVTTDSNGNAAFSDFLTCLTASGEKITATATDAYGNTSAFSREVIAHLPPVLVTPPLVSTQTSEIDLAVDDAMSQTLDSEALSEAP